MVKKIMKSVLMVDHWQNFNNKVFSPPNFTGNQHQIVIQ